MVLGNGVRRVFTVVAACALGASAGCYKYSAVPIGDVQPGMSVRVRLSGTEVERLRAAPQARLLEGFRVSGRIEQLGTDSLRLAVPTTVMEPNVRARTVDRDLSIVRAEVREVELRRLDRARTTWTVVALGAATIGSIAFALQRGGRATGSVPPPTGPPEIRIPLGIRLQIP